MKQLRKNLLAASIVLAAIFCNGCAKDSDEKVIRLNYSIFFPPSHIHTKLAQDWADEITRRSSGRVAIKLFPGGILTKADQCYSGVVDGISDIGMSSFAYTRGRFPLLEGLDLPLGYYDGISATRVANEMLAKYQPKELKGTHILFLHAHGPGVLASCKPVRNLKDAEGLSCRGTGFSAKIVDLLGGNSIGMPQNDTYEALQKGVVDATLCPIETLKGWKQGEVINYVTKTPAIGYTTAMFVTMNLERWNSLPHEIKTIFEEVSEEWIDKHGKAWNDADSEACKMLEEMGKETILLTEEETKKWQEKVRPILDLYAQTAESKGLPGKAFLNDMLDAVKRNNAISVKESANSNGTLK